MDVVMSPSRPYLLRAYYDWLLDNELTPHLVVNAEWPEVMVPMEFVQNGQIVLNIAPSAVVSFQMDLDAVSFNARFGGIARQLYIPIAAILAIYARETGAGTVFESEPAYEQSMTAAPGELGLVDSDDKKAGPTIALAESAKPSEVDREDKKADQPDAEKRQDTASPVKKTPTLRVIK